MHILSYLHEFVYPLHIQWDLISPHQSLVKQTGPYSLSDHSLWPCHFIALGTADVQNMYTIVLEATDLKIIDILVTPNSKLYARSYKSMNKFLWFKIPSNVPILMLRSSRMWNNFTTHGQLAHSRLCFNSFVLLIVYHWYKMSCEVHCKQFNQWCFQISCVTIWQMVLIKSERVDESLFAQQNWQAQRKWSNIWASLVRVQFICCQKIGYSLVLRCHIW